ncbi:formylglycine-generating enzyme family protein [Leucobacter rhizosphaerae]|uniref:Formylglycine-generating enzyme family protein n=1 Tax=Leucobacter rhizosphaerae TaxID=2932245 RepID=A0ABY4FV30_9MICO|nr:SUMF1/EgtB/PvdO family nonheme iron enzyme [Leucobacter rhizosphaerae]UOQ60024.1 formylglycine-generating enzyme family protein [Leucobacter rhizosphaerae]
MPQLLEIAAGPVRLDDARRGTTRSVDLQSYRIGAFPVTTAEYTVRAHGHFDGDSNSNSNSNSALPDADELPVAGVRWIDAITWCNAASIAAGFEPAYALDEGTVTWRLHAAGFRLPTEAEWVRACRAGTDGARYGELDQIAWSAADEITGPQPVGRKNPNAFGLHDTLGNVWEWCWDRLDPARYGDYRVLKGGGWADPEWSCRAGVRRGDAPDARLEDTGFRIAQGAPGPEGQGWSEAEDRRRAATPGPRPVGWTPLASA